MKHMNTSILIGHSFLRASCYRLDKHSSQIIFGFICALLIGISNLFYPRLHSVLQPDSESYLTFDPIRSSFYPAFLDVIDAFGDGHESIIMSQVTLHIVSVGFMFYLLACARIPLMALLVFMLAIMANFYLQAYHFTILTESLSMSLLFLTIGTFCVYITERGKYMLFLSMLFAAILLGMKANAIAIPIGLILVSSVLIFIGHDRYNDVRLSFAVLFLPLFLVMSGERYLYFKSHENRESLLERHLFGKAAVIMAFNEDKAIFDGEFSSLEAPINDFRIQTRRPIDANYAAGNYCLWLRAHAGAEVHGYYKLANDELSALAKKTGLSVGDIKLKFSLQVFSQHPVTLAKIIGKQYVNFFCVASGHTPKFADAEPNKPSDQIEETLKRVVQFAFIILGCGFFLASFYCLIKAVSWIINRKQDVLMLERFGVSMMLWAVGYNLSISIFAVSVPRYMVLSYPLIVLAIICLLTASLETYLNKKDDAFSKV